jgi:hypothetical protein
MYLESRKKRRDDIKAGELMSAILLTEDENIKEIIDRKRNEYAEMID